MSGHSECYNRWYSKRFEGLVKGKEVTDPEAIRIVGVLGGNMIDFRLNCYRLLKMLMSEVDGVE